MSFKVMGNSDDNSYWLYYLTNVRTLSASTPNCHQN